MKTELKSTIFFHHLTISLIYFIPTLKCILGFHQQNSSTLRPRTQNGSNLIHSLDINFCFIQTSSTWLIIFGDERNIVENSNSILTLRLQFGSASDGGSRRHIQADYRLRKDEYQNWNWKNDEENRNTYIL